MKEKNKITESLLILLGFILKTDINGVKTYINADNDMVFILGEANMPILSRWLKGHQKDYEYIGGYEYFEDAKKAFEEKSIPQMLSDDKIDLSELKKLLKSIVDDILNDESDEDDEHWVYETALKTFYGKDIFDTLNRYF